ncbi:hypothetical protein BDN71DRAFT_1506628 [Pleurotus eryngii]|uniref:Uncharacterized protein n=1 Tax=Pleurotus eryngii TaxID=5323 RepID=A0A9P5ZVZ2_PLEER|nr:hypothetical protein BDN71DRAFT_1506628 [Pleurotus eryngii]
MPLNETLTNTSPRLQYSPPSAWSDALLDDPFYRATSSSAGKGTVSLTWRGVSIWIYGGYRERLGSYQIALDGEVETFPGYIQGSTPHGNVLLFGRRDLDESHMHTFELTNLGENGQVLDLDYIVLEHQAFVPEESPSSFLNKRSEGHATKTPLIAGVSVISVLVVVMVCMVIWWRRQKNFPKKAAKDRQLIPDPYLCSTDMVSELPLVHSPTTRALSHKSSFSYSNYSQSSHGVASPPPSHPSLSRHQARKVASSPSLRTHARVQFSPPPSTISPYPYHAIYPQRHDHHQNHHRQYPRSHEGHGSRVTHDALRRSRSDASRIRWPVDALHQPGAEDPHHHRTKRPSPAVII